MRSAPVCRVVQTSRTVIDEVKAFRRITAALLTFAALLMLMSCGGNSSGKTMIRAAGFDVSYDMVRYVTMNVKDLYTPEQLADEEIQDEIQKCVFDTLSEMYIYKYLSGVYGVKPGKDDLQSVEDDIDALRENCGSDEKYTEYLAEQYMTENVEREFLTLNLYSTLLYVALTENSFESRFKSDVDTINADLKNDNWYSAEWVLIPYTDSNKDTMKALADTIADEVNRLSYQMESSYLDHLKENNDMSYKNDGCFTDTIYYDILQSNVTALEIGEVSEPIDFGGVFCVMKRNKVKSTYIEEKFNTVTAYYLTREFNFFVKEKKTEVTVELVGDYKDFKLYQMQ